MAAKIVTRVTLLTDAEAAKHRWHDWPGTPHVIRIETHLDNVCGPTAPLQLTSDAIADLKKILSSLEQPCPPTKPPRTT